MCVSTVYASHKFRITNELLVSLLIRLKRCANIYIYGIDLKYVYTTIFDCFLCDNAAYIAGIENHVERNRTPNRRCFAHVYVICGYYFILFFLVGVLSHGRRPQDEYQFYTVIFAVCLLFFSRVHSEYRMTHSYALFDNRI